MNKLTIGSAQLPFIVFEVESTFSIVKGYEKSKKKPVTSNKLESNWKICEQKDQ